MKDWKTYMRQFIKDHRLEEKEWVCLLKHITDEECAILKDEAVRIRQLHFGQRIYIRGLIEFTNYCKNDCYYCGIRHGNLDIVRYRLTKEEILECCESGYRLGFRTFVLQGGEDPYYTDERMQAIVSAIRHTYPDCAITLSIGERSKESYRLLKEAGADRFLLRHETADEMHYRYLHPEQMSFEHRRACLNWLKELGYQTGAGMMVGSPGQTIECLAKDLVFLQDLKPEMIGVGPFIPHHQTKFASENAGSVDKTLLLLSILRIMFPKVLLPATTALGSISDDGREQGILAGCNVVMPNLSPASYRKQYELYDHKICTGAEAAESIQLLKEKMAAIGYEVVVDRGDFQV